MNAQEELQSLTREGKCPDCGGATFRMGPEGGLSQNIECASCHKCNGLGYTDDEIELFYADLDGNLMETM